jgi:hypothetical protein
VRDAYEIYCAWCLSNGRTPPTREFWNDFVSIVEAHKMEVDDDGEEIERQDSQGHG